MRELGSAWHVALRRAAHQHGDSPVLFRDPFAVPLLGPAYAESARRISTKDRPWSRALRAFAVARSLYTEELLASSAARGLRQYCLLGAGLDTFAWRNPYPHLHVWEVDRPTTAAAKTALAARAGFPAPPRCTPVSADLADAHLGARLAAAGLRTEEPVLFAMLGVAPYLPADALQAILTLVRAHGPGSGIVLDYRLPRRALPEEEQRQHDSLAARVAARGEPFLSGWTPEEMAAELRGFGTVEDLDTEALNRRYFAGRADGLAAKGCAARLVSAFV